MSNTSTQFAESEQPKKSNQRSKYANIGRRPGAMGGHRGAVRVTENAVSFFPSLKRLLKQLRPDRTMLIFVVLMGIVSVVFNVYSPRLLGFATDIIFSGAIGMNAPGGLTKTQYIDQLRAGGNDQLADMASGINFVPGQAIDFDALTKVIVLALVLYLLASLLSFLQHYLLNIAVQRSIYRMRREFQQKLDRLPLAYFDKQPRGELLSRMTNDIDNIAQSLQQTLGQLLNSLLTVAGVAIMMFFVSPLLALITVLVVPVAGLCSALIGKRAQRQFVKMWDSTGELNAQVEEAFTGHSLVKVFGRRKEVEARFLKVNDDLRQATLRAQFMSGLIMPVNFLVGNLNYVFIAIIGGLRVASGQMPLGSVQAFIQYSRMFTQPITQIASMANLLQSGVASAERVFEVLDETEMSADGDAVLPTKLEGKVQFKNVSFSYQPNQNLIEALNLVADPGQTIAIVGPTGAGKTTLVNLLERFYETDDGVIEIDGVNIASVPRSHLRSSLGMVLQDSWLFAGTIRENIAYGRPDASQDEVINAAKAAFVDRFVRQLPDGYDTMIDSEGSNISAGQKQLVTIARAFIKNPEILILDEATSSVDTRTEVLVQEAMNRLRAGRTSFVIAHRLSTIRGADLILVMKDGAIVESGNHDQLIQAKGAYFELYQSQFRAADDEPAQPIS